MCRHISFPPGWGSMLSRPQRTPIVQTGNTPPTGVGNYQSGNEGCKHHHWAANVQSYCPSWWCTGFSWWEFKGSCSMQALRWSCVCRLRYCRWLLCQRALLPLQGAAQVGGWQTALTLPHAQTLQRRERGQEVGAGLGFSPSWLSGIHGSISALKEKSKQKLT